MQGRKPKPNHLKAVNGNPGKRKLNENEPKPAGEARCPQWLHPNAKKEWKRLAAELKRLKLLSLMDTAAFAGYCESYALYRDCIEFIHKHGTSYPVKDDDGRVKMIRPFPQVIQANQHLQNICRFAAEFGFTPSARGRIEADSLDNQASPMAEYLKRKSQGK